MEVGEGRLSDKKRGTSCHRGSGSLCYLHKEFMGVRGSSSLICHSRTQQAAHRCQWIASAILCEESPLVRLSLPGDRFEGLRADAGIIVGPVPRGDDELALLKNFIVFTMEDKVVKELI